MALSIPKDGSDFASNCNHCSLAEVASTAGDEVVCGTTDGTAAVHGVAGVEALDGKWVTVEGWAGGEVSVDAREIDREITRMGGSV